MKPNEIFARSGLNRAFIEQLSGSKYEPDWMREYRLAAFEWGMQAPMPLFGPNWSRVPFEQLRYYVAALREQQDTQASMPPPTPYAGVGAQQESDALYHELQNAVRARGVIFTSLDDAVHRYPDLVRTHFGSVVSHTNNVFAALNTALWSGGVFLYVPAHVQFVEPLYMHYVVRTCLSGQFERTLCIIEADAAIEYREGCGAALPCEAGACVALHAAVVELILKERARVRYVTIQRWPHQMATATTKSAHVGAGAHISWFDINDGSGILMKYPTVKLLGVGAQADLYSLSMARDAQMYDTGGRILCMAPHSRGSIIARTLAYDMASATFRGFGSCVAEADHARVYVRCDTLMIGEHAFVAALPHLESRSKTAQFAHEATVRSVDQEALFYCMSRGLSATDAERLLVRGFVEPFLQVLPADIALEVDGLFAFDEQR